MQQGKTITNKIYHSLRLGRALRLVWQSAPSWTIASAALLILQGVLPLVALYLMKLIVDGVAAGLEASSEGYSFEHIMLLIFLAGLVAMISILCQSLSGFVSKAQTQYVTDYMLNVVHAKSIEVDLEYYENSRYYDTLYRAQQEAPFRPPRIVNGLIRLCQSLISLTAMVGLLFAFHWGIALILFAATVPGIFVSLRHSDKMYRWRRQRTSTERKADYYDWMLTDGKFAKEIRLFDLGLLFISRFRNLRKLLRREELKIAARHTVMDLLVQICAAFAVYGSYAFIAYRAVQGSITLGDLVMYFQAFQRGQGFLRDVLSSIAGLYQDNLFLTNLYEFLDLKPKVVEPSSSKPVPKPMQTGIAFDHVSFKYPTCTENVLEDISLIIRPGEVAALVGENGSGKTTLIKLLCRLYNPTGGSITLDGNDLRLFKTMQLRSQLSIIFQDYVQYHLTVRENIWFGNIDLPDDHERIVFAAQHSGVEDVIAGLKNGYETTLGTWFEEDGKELSIGEWQKIALARAFFRDSQIIILDEPTSAMDAKTEYEVFHKFRQLAEGRTAIIISHRFSTVRMADHIYVMNDGRIIENGSHEELVCLGGKYAKMFEMQAEAYR